MSRTMRRWGLVGMAALGAVGAAGDVTPGSATAEAAPNVSPFAGTYTGWLPVSEVGGFNYWTKIDISDRGVVRSSSRFSFPTPYPPTYSDTAHGTLGGSVSSGGAMSLSGVIRYGSGDSIEFSLAATATLDDAGNLSGTTLAGNSFTWTRK